ncbi:MAG: sodium:calcium antiporter [Candidatus Rokubacteria bacterium]|nr:sodium:calcium antiporter [Candidatus Rokubacteria bacterium]
MKPLLLELLTGRGPLIPLLGLVAAGALVFVIASRLARDADTIAAQTGLGGLWIGSVLLAAGTSLPEMLTDVNAALLDVPDIGVGDLFGSTLANMLILAVLDLVFARRRILHAVATEHAILGLLGILLTVMAGIAILVGGWGRIGHVGIETIAIAVVYAGGMRLLYREVAAGPVPEAGAERHRGARRWRALAGFVLGALGLAAATPLLVLSADAFARESGLTATFVGTLLVGLTTSFPEMSATVSAVRLGALDLAVGNVFGSNAFNMVVLLLMDLFYLRGPVLAIASRGHLLTVLVAVTCLVLGIMAILSRAQRRSGPVLLESALIVAAYLAGAWLLYQLGA